MTLRSVPIDSITADHLQYLVDDRVAEKRTIEYKRELPGNAEREKKEFLADVCAFANTAGGDLVYGINAPDGIPRELPGFETSNIDDEKLRLEHLIHTGIGPRLSVKAFQPLELRNGKYALVIRVPRSFARPHVVDFKGHWRFYMRNSAGKYPMDVDEVRWAFALSESIADRIRAFRTERLGRVATGETPWTIETTSKVVLHVVPISAFDSPVDGVDLDIRRPPLNEDLLFLLLLISELSEEGLEAPVRSHPSDYRPRYNFDGVFCPVHSEDHKGYVQLFRTGVIEAADHFTFVEQEGRSGIKGHILGDRLDDGLIKAVHRYFRLLRALGVEPPIFLMLSLVGVSGYQMLNVPLSYRSARRQVDRDDLVVPEVMVDSLEHDLPALQRHMRPLLDAVWNAVGLPGSPHYDESGNWHRPPPGII